MKIDRTEIKKALQLFFRAGDVFEVRVLDAVTDAYPRPHVESGYFTFETIDAVPDALAAIRIARGCYVTANPVAPALLARAANRIRDVRRDPLTADKDVVSRRWLLIDCDARRQAGIPSSDAEHAAALALAARIADEMAGDWGRPVLTDSGNGAQLMYPVDLPAEDGELCRDVLAAAGRRWSSPEVEIDLAVHNPARIWRLPGTFNVKGDEIGDRRHRMARILSVPDRLDPVPAEKLQAFRAAYHPLPDLAGSEVVPAPRGAFDLDAWIARCCPELGAPQAWQGGRKWIFPICPFNPDHTNKSAVLIQQPGGAIAFRCHHNGCAGNDWRALRALRDPDHPAAELHAPAVYGGELEDPTETDPAAPPLPDSATRHVNPGPLDPALLRVPGFISDVMAYDLATAPYPNRVLAFAGAVTLTAFLTSRKFRDSSNVMTNLYLIALANSGSGKEHPRKVNQSIAYAAGLADRIGDSFASGEGIEDAMMYHRAMLFQPDELDGVFSSITRAQDGRNEMIMNVLLKMYSASGSIYTARAKAYNSRSGSPTMRSAVCDRPCLSLFGTAVPKYLYESLNGRMLENGFFARTLIIEADARGRGQEAEYAEPPATVVETAKYWGDLLPGPGNLADEHPDPAVVPFAPGVREMYQQYRAEADDQYAQNEDRHDLPAMAMWNRAFEKARKLALLYALSGSPESPVITPDAARWGWDLATYQTRRQLYMAERYVADNPFHQACLRLLRKLQDCGGRVPRRDMLRLLHVKVADLEQFEEYLVSTGQMEVRYEGDGLKSRKVYYVSQK